MERIPFSEIDDFREAEINGIPGLFTEYRIDRRTLPEGVHCYEIRGSDDGSENFCTVEPSVVVNFTGTVITRQEIPLCEDAYSEIREYGLSDESTDPEWVTRSDEERHRESR